MTRPNDIEPFDTYLEHGTVREMEADPSTARNLYNRAERKFDNMETLGIGDATATDYRPPKR